MLDSLDNKLVEGVLSINDFDKEKTSGTYSKDKVFNDSFPGFNSMKGFFNGKVDVKGKKVSINMNPKIADNNIFISCEIKKDSLIGKWIFSTMLGTSRTGKFYAKKSRSQ